MQNPLSHLFRQPALTITLPSQGRFWDAESIDFGETNELSVMPMTARDEISLKQPDSLMSGQGTVDVIKSCVPQIKNPWNIPSIDLDTILLGIRIATYGNTLDLETTVPEVNEKQTVQVDLIQLMETLKSFTVNNVLTIDQGIEVEIKPMNYKQLTKLALITYEEQRLMRTVLDSKMSESEKIKEYQRIFLNLANTNIEQLSDAIVSIKAQDTVVEDRKQINEFVNNVSATTAKQIQEKIAEIRRLGTIKPLEVNTPDEMVSRGAPKTYTTAINMDASNFFVRKY